MAAWSCCGVTRGQHGLTLPPGNPSSARPGELERGALRSPGLDREVGARDLHGGASQQRRARMARLLSGTPTGPPSVEQETSVPCNLSEDLKNLTLEELKVKFLGPQQYHHFVPICVTYLLIFAVGVVGNALTCAVILRHKTMRTPTNYYLFSLAVSDLLLLLAGLPMELYELWQNYPYLLGVGGCYLRTQLFEIGFLASVLNVTALSVERYVAVVHPLRARSLVTGAHVRRVLAAIWILATLSAVPNTSLQEVKELEVDCWGLVPDTSSCTVAESQKDLYNLVVQVTTLLFFFLPMGVISVLYLLIGRQLQRERLLAPGQGAGPDDSSKRSSLKERGRTQVTKMLFVLVVLFAVCWAPFHTERLLWSFVTDWTPDSKEAYEYVHIFSGVLLYVGSAANPVLYSLMSTRFRETFQDVLCLGSTCRAAPGHGHSISRVATGTTLFELGSTGGKGHPLAENGDPQQNEPLPSGPGSASLSTAGGPSGIATPSPPDPVGGPSRFRLGTD
ncbi:neuromedin-U receptor 1 [Sorex fumeus]|uniref:neuromedin-U receptor 1 n=1 Tax=Sorex fumeus TaxID=62283 RepID=UPI0024ADD01A|nr:neuromedin-U receptor 1 [Sorex fumeus]